jgi:uncharacterized protein
MICETASFFIYLSMDYENYKNLISHTVEFVQSKLKAFDGGHDWFHTERVWKLAKTICKKEQAGDIQIIELASLLHDIADSKFHDGPESLGGDLAFEFMREEGVDEKSAVHVREIINQMSFKSRLKDKSISSIEFQIVQDADRIDAIGAIGIARAFNYGGFKNRAIHDPDQPIQEYATMEAYKKSDAATINHFYEKLFLLKNLMNTSTGKAIAGERHLYMEDYVKRFMKEWDGEA